MDDSLNKPVTVVRAEFISNLTNLINESKLPLFVVEPILKDVYLEVRDASQKQYEHDLMNYNQLKQKQLDDNNHDD
jgi:hypothetical protein